MGKARRDGLMDANNEQTHRDGKQDRWEQLILQCQRCPAAF